MFTNLCRVPSSVRTWLDMPGYSATSFERPSPMVAPSTLTVEAPPAWLRRTVGRRTSTATGPPRSVWDDGPAGPGGWLAELLTDSVTILQGARPGPYPGPSRP